MSEGFKEKTSTKLYNGIKSKMENVTLPTLMDATNIWGRGFGKKRFKIILKQYPDILTSNLTLEEKETEVGKVQGMAKKSSKLFVENINKFKEWAESANLQSKLNYIDDEQVDDSHQLYDKNIIMTGFRDKELTEELEKVGAKLGTAVSKKTFAVIVKDKDDDTGKINEAKKLNIPLFTVEEFKNNYNL